MGAPSEAAVPGLRLRISDAMQTIPRSSSLGCSRQLRALNKTKEYTRAVFDHVAINVSDMDASRAFFEAALAPIGYEVSFESAEWVGMRAGERNDFGLVRRDPVGATVHIAFEASDRATVDAFHAAALAAGGTDNGAPGIRSEYGDDYYAAFVIGPDGHNVEAVTQKPE